MNNNAEVFIPRVFEFSVVGEAMEPILANGDSAFVDPEKTSPSLGDIVLISCDGETLDGRATPVRPAFLGYWMIRDGAYLDFANHAFDPMCLNSFYGWKVEGTVIAFGTPPRLTPLIDILEPPRDPRSVGDVLKLSRRTMSALSRAGIVSITDLLTRTHRDLASMKLVGPVTLSEIINALDEAALKLQERGAWQDRAVKYRPERRSPSSLP
jgi:hypothetical protein